MTKKTTMKKEVKSKKKTNGKFNPDVCPICAGRMKYQFTSDRRECTKCNYSNLGYSEEWR